MNSFERYAALALLFLVVLVTVFAFGGDGGAEPAQAAEPLTRPTATRVEEPVVVGGERSVARGAARGAEDVVLAGVDPTVPERDTVTTRYQTGADHALESRGRREESRRIELQQPTARTETKRADLQRPSSTRAAATAPETLKPSRSPMQPTRGKDPVAEAGGSHFLTREGTGRPEPAPRLQSPRVESKKKAKESGAKVAKAPKENSDAKPVVRSGAASRTYVVKGGDSLSTIASNECGTVSAMNEIVLLNGLDDPDKIWEGMELKLPERKVAKADAAPVAPSVPTVRSPQASTARADGRPVITLQKGDILGRLLEKRYGTVSASLALVKELNPGLNPDRVRAGQTLVLPRFDEVEGARIPRAAADEAPRLAKDSTPRRTSGNYVR